MQIVKEPVTTYHRKEIERVQVTSSLSISKYLENLYNQYPDHHEQEHFFIVLLNRANVIIGHELVGIGGVCSVIVSIPTIIKKALSHAGINGIILTHNHPSGRLKPSRQDIEVTQRTTFAANVMDLNILDHIIYQDSRYYSFADEGEMPKFSRMQIEKTLNQTELLTSGYA